MEKWGWQDGDGLGKDRNGMTSCLNVRTDGGYATIEQSSPKGGSGAQQPPVSPNPFQQQGNPNPLQSSSQPEGRSEARPNEEGAPRRSKWDMGSGGEPVPRPSNSIGPYAISKAAAAKGKQAAVPNSGGDWKGKSELPIPPDKREYMRRLFSTSTRFVARFFTLFKCELSISERQAVVITPTSPTANLAGGNTVIKEVMAQKDPKKLQELMQEYLIKDSNQGKGAYAKDDPRRQPDHRGKGSLAQDEQQRHFDLAQQNATRFRHGLGDISPKNPQSEQEVQEMLKIDPHNVQLIASRLNELQVASGATFGIAQNGNVCVQGSRNAVERAKQTVRHLIEHGRVDSNFVKSSDSTSGPPPRAPAFQPAPPQEPPPPLASGLVLPVSQEVSREVNMQVSKDKILIVQCMLAHIIKCSGAENCVMAPHPSPNGKTAFKVRGKQDAISKAGLIINEIETAGQSAILFNYLKEAAAPSPPTAVTIQSPEALHAVQSLQAALSSNASGKPAGIPGLEMSAVPGLGGIPWLGGLPLGNIPLPPVQQMVQPFGNGSFPPMPTGI